MILIKTTVKDTGIIKLIISELLNKKYATCINIINNVESHYLWNNKLVKDKESILFIKTISKNEEIIYKVIKDFHDYDIPEIITINIQNVDVNYLNWMKQNITKKAL